MERQEEILYDLKDLLSNYLKLDDPNAQTCLAGDIFNTITTLKSKRKYRMIEQPGSIVFYKLKEYLIEYLKLDATEQAEFKHECYGLIVDAKQVAEALSLCIYWA